MEDDRKAIASLQQESNGRMKTSAIAEHVGVEPPTVTSIEQFERDRPEPAQP